MTSNNVLCAVQYQQESLMQQQHSHANVQQSFSWSDFPILETNFGSQFVPFYQLKSPSFDNEETVTANANTNNCLEMEPEHCDSYELGNVETSQPPSQEKVPTKKRVHFSNLVHVRIHKLELGYHPCCSGGLALECGWQYLEEPEIWDLNVHERYSAPKRSQKALRTTYSERRRRLQAATGLSGVDLLRIEYNMMCQYEDGGFNNDDAGVRKSDNKTKVSDTSCSLLHRVPTLSSSSLFALEC